MNDSTNEWPDDMEWPWEGHDPGECRVCDWNRARLKALDEDQPDPGPFPGWPDDAER